MLTILTSVICGVVVAITPVTGFAQGTGRPDFSGAWIKHVKEPKPGALREVVTVTQDESGMKVSLSVEGRTESETVRYEFGKTAAQESPVPTIQAAVTTSWQGAILKASSEITTRSGVRRFDQLWYIDKEGHLTIATVTPQPDGAPSRSTVSVYRRQ